MTQNQVLHVAFGPSAAGTLRQVVAELGRTDRVTFLADDLSFGPINPANPQLRSEWMQQELGEVDNLGYGPDFEPRIAAFWAETTSPDSRPIAWFSRHCVREYTGFLELLWRRPDALVRFVDVADHDFTLRDGAELEPRFAGASRCFGFVPAAQIVARGLMDRSQSMPSNVRDEARARWQNLKTENAALRVLGPSGLVSAPISHFDDVITSHTTNEWQVCARVIGASLHTTSEGPYVQADDTFLWQRLLELMDTEVLEGRGDLSTYRDSSVRRRPS